MILMFSKFSGITFYLLIERREDCPIAYATALSLLDNVKYDKHVLEAEYGSKANLSFPIATDLFDRNMISKSYCQLNVGSFHLSLSPFDKELILKKRSNLTVFMP